MISELVEKLLNQDKRALARLLTLLETEPENLSDIMSAVRPHSTGSYCVGLTGPPGAGKSTMVNSLIEVLRSEDMQVGVLAVDPSSPFTGGSVLGDRIRMQKHYLDDDVFIRSLATRGAQGGLSVFLSAAIAVMDAFGFKYVIVETVGVGQTELDVMRVADTVIVLTVPEAGDTIQSIKAGLMEVADIFVVNKMDRDGSSRMAATIKSSINMGEKDRDWKTPVLLTQADKGLGVEGVFKSVLEHRRMLEETHKLDQARRERRTDEFRNALMNMIRTQTDLMVRDNAKLASLVKLVEDGAVDPYTAAQNAINQINIFDTSPD
ncbi:MAG: methylmalonyl Co-A mutase-associated GTPase MeaB [Chloroflexota bacterium]|nr:methylmalonyl Co-A mutase-associated GTPase MeaB [Chloroflexota bacterium]